MTNRTESLVVFLLTTIITQTGVKRRAKLEFMVEIHFKVLLKNHFNYSSNIEKFKIIHHFLFSRQYFL